MTADYYETKYGKCCIGCFYGFHKKDYPECVCLCHNKVESIHHD